MFTPSPPKLTFPPEEAEALRQAYSASKVILEYGSGGSTVEASKLRGKSIVTVESDKQWAADLDVFIRTNPKTLSCPIIKWVDIGRTTHWGWPVDTKNTANFYRYSVWPWTAIFNRNPFQGGEGVDSLIVHSDENAHPDTILIDGRFRLACFWASYFFCRKPATIIFDDYLHRSYHEAIEKTLQPTRLAGRMAIFEINPKVFEPNLIEIMLKSFADPR